MTVDTTRIEGQSATFSSKVKTTQLFANHQGHTEEFIGDLHVRGKLTTEDFNVSGKSTKDRKHTGESGHQDSLTLDDGSLYIGLMRRPPRSL